MYFEEGCSKVDIAKTLGVHRNTVTNDVKNLIEQFEIQDGKEKIAEFFYKQKSLLDSQQFRILQKLKTESDFGKNIKLEKLLMGSFDRDMKFYLKFMPMINKHPKVDKNIVKKVIRDLAFDRFIFINEGDLIKGIINKTKCDLSTANSIVYEMKKLGLDYSKFFESRATEMVEFAKICGGISGKEYRKIQNEDGSKDGKDVKSRNREKFHNFDENPQVENEYYSKLLEKAEKRLMRGESLYSKDFFS